MSFKVRFHISGEKENQSYRDTCRRARKVAFITSMFTEGKSHMKCCCESEYSDSLQFLNRVDCKAVDIEINQLNVSYLQIMYTLNQMQKRYQQGNIVIQHYLQ